MEYSSANRTFLNNALAGNEGPISAHNAPSPTKVPWSIIFALLVVALLKFKAHNGHKSRLRSLTGQKIHEIRHDARVLKFIASSALSQEGRRTAGTQPYLIRNGRHRELVLTKPEHIQDFYKDDTKNHTKPLNLNMGAYFGRILGEAVGVKYGERWRIIRKYFDPEFSFQKSRLAIPAFERSVKRWVDSLAPLSGVEYDEMGSFAVDTKKPCKFLTFKLLYMQLYGETFSEKAYLEMLDLNALHETVLHDVILNARLTHRLWNWLNRPAAGRAAMFNDRWEKLNLKLIRHARENGLECPAERIFAGVDQAKEMTKLEFLHTMDEIFFANVDVSSAVLTTMLKQLASHKDFQRVLRDEIQDRKAQVDYNITNYIVEQSSHLNHLIMESMRLTPAFDFSLPQCTAMDKHIGGFYVPANTAVVIDAGHLNSDPDTWGTDANVFNPDRFATMSQSKCRYSYMRFGVGGASGRCLGKNFADAIFKLTAVAVLEKYELSIPEDEGKGDVCFSLLSDKASSWVLGEPVLI